jgi:hypothetical protein
VSLFDVGAPLALGFGDRRPLIQTEATMIHNMKKKHVRTTMLTVAIAVLLTTAATGLTAGERVVVRVASGRTFDAQIAARSDANNLWLSFRTRSAELLRPIAWNSVVSAELGGETLTATQLRQRVLSRPVSFTTQAVEESEAPVEQLPTPVGQAEANMADEALQVLFAPPVPRVASVRFDAFIANWDGDVDADGLIVQAIPVDAYGHVVPAKGHVEVELYTTRRIAFQDAPHKRGRRIEQIGRWTKQILPQQVHVDGAWFKLPFQAADPEFDNRLGFSGLVHVKLVVPGAGVFESSLDGVRIRPFSPLRDNMEQVEGRRFLANERTSRGVWTN